jgi:hypothetical protein
MGLAVKKLLAFALLMTFVGMLTVSTVGCGKKTTTTAAGTVAATEKVTATTEKK